jgi:hypothetical protein
MNTRPIIVPLVIAAICATAHAQNRQPKPPATTSQRTMIFSPMAAAEITPAPGEAPSTAAQPSSPGQLAAVFFTLLQKNEVDLAYAGLTKGSKIAEKPEELRQLKAKTIEAIEVFGAITGYDLAESKAVGNRLLRATYVSHGKTFPLRWRFYFYKPEETWRLIDLRVDDKLTGIFDEPDDRRDAADAKP